MDLSKVLEHLRWELEHLDRAIRSLEQLNQKHSFTQSDISAPSEPSRSRPRAVKVRRMAVRKASNKAE